MDDNIIGSVHWSFWVLGSITLIFNVMGVINFFMQMSADSLTSFPECQKGSFLVYTIM